MTRVRTIQYNIDMYILSNCHTHLVPHTHTTRVMRVKLKQQSTSHARLCSKLMTSRLNKFQSNFL